MRRIVVVLAYTVLGLSGFTAAAVAAGVSPSAAFTPAQTTTTGGTTTGTTTGTTATTTTGTTATTITVTTTTVEPPQNTTPPAISGQATAGQTLSASTGSWSGTQPITFAYQWQRCDQSGLNCANISGATSQTYALQAADVGRTIRVAVTGQNSAGSSTAFSAPTAPVQAGGPAGQIRLPSGEISIPVTSVSLPARLIVDRVVFIPNPIRSRTRAFTIRVRVKDTRNFAVRGALVRVRPLPLVSTAPPETATSQDGWVTLRSRPRRVRGLVFPLQRGLNVQFYAQARKPGERLLFGVTGTRLVQVATAPPF
jgi:Ig domain of plant-specific actin-binding protein